MSEPATIPDVSTRWGKGMRGGRRGLPKTHSDRAPFAAAPEHALMKFFRCPLKARFDRDGRIGPHELKVGILELD